MDTLLTVIIPVYNVAETLPRCIKSIISQETCNCEVILVDDGSTDGSSAIADEYAGRVDCISVYHKKNGGLSDARNYGLARTRGQYITFADSDDEVAPGTYSHLLSMLKEHPEYDILEYPVLQNPGRADETLFSPGDNVFDDPLDWLAYRGTEHCWAWNKIYKRKLFTADTLFPVGRKYEDMLILPLILRQRPVIATTNGGMYLYHYNGSGIMASDKNDGLAQLLKAQLELVEKLGIDTRERRWHRIYINMLTAQIHAYAKTGRTTLRSQHVRLGGYATWKDSVKALLVNLLGVKNTCRLLAAKTKA